VKDGGKRVVGLSQCQSVDTTYNEYTNSHPGATFTSYKVGKVNRLLIVNGAICDRCEWCWSPFPRPWASSECKHNSEKEGQTSACCRNLPGGAAGIKLYCLVTEAQCVWTTVPGSAPAGNWTSDLAITSPTHCHHQATSYKPERKCPITKVAERFFRHSRKLGNCYDLERKSYQPSLWLAGFQMRFFVQTQNLTKPIAVWASPPSWN